MRPTRVHSKTAAALLSVVLASTGCGSAAAPGAAATGAATAAATLPALPWGRSFLSTEVTENGAAKALLDGTRIRVEFNEERLSASAGCNSLSGPAYSDGERLVVIDAAMTELGCEPFAGHTAQDEWLAGFVRSKPRWTLQGTRLTLDNGATSIVLDDRKVSEPDRALRGTRWVVETIVESESASSIPPGVEAYLEFGERDVTGSGGCNSLSGAAAVDEANATITFSDVGSTKKGCEEARTRVEKAVHQTLRGRARFRIDGNKLVLTGPGGHGVHLRAAVPG